MIINRPILGEAYSKIAENDIVHLYVSGEESDNFQVATVPQLMGASFWNETRC